MVSSGNSRVAASSDNAKIRVTLGQASRVTQATVSGAAPPLRHAQTQTDSTYPGVDVRASAEEALSGLHCRHYACLLQLRDHVRGIFTELGSAVHDLAALKDVFTKMADTLPIAPVTDLILVSSRTSRRASDLARAVGAMFAEIFSEDFIDEDFHFTEARIMKRALRDAEKHISELSAERDVLKSKNDVLSAAAERHQQVVDRLCEERDTLSRREAGLEDNMAVLFHQIATDFVGFHNAEMRILDQDTVIHDDLSSVRAQFAQSVEALQGRLRFFQVTLSEIQNDVSSRHDPAGSLKSKLKALDAHVAQISDRFIAVKDGLMNTADELAAVLNEKRRLVNFSLQHLKAYNAQNQRMRRVRALMHDLRQRLSQLIRSVTASSSSAGELVIVSTTDTASPERGTRRHHSSSSPSSSHSMVELARGLHDLSNTISDALNTDEEHAAVLRSISLAIPRSAAATQQRPHHTLPSSEDVFQPPPISDDTATSQADNTEASRLREDFITKAKFLREVYEERISDLEYKVEVLQKKLLASKREAEEATALSRAGVASVADDRSLANHAKDTWIRHRNATQSVREDEAHDAVSELGRIERPYYSPLATVVKFSPRQPVMPPSSEGEALFNRPSVAMPVSSASGARRGGAELLRTQHSRQIHAQNVEVIRKLRDLAKDMDGSAKQ